MIRITNARNGWILNSDTGVDHVYVDRAQLLLAVYRATGLWSVGDEIQIIIPKSEVEKS